LKFAQSAFLERGLFEIDTLPIPALDTCTNLLRSPSRLRLLIGIDSLFHAGGTGCSVRSLEATVQAVVSQGPVTVAVAWLLMQYFGNLGSHLICDDLIGMRKVDAGQLVGAEQWWQGLCRGSRVVGGNVC